MTVIYVITTFLRLFVKIFDLFEQPVQYNLFIILKKTNFVRDKMKARFFTIVLIVGDLRHIRANTKALEDEYNVHFGNECRYRTWSEARTWYLEDDEPLLKKYCAEAHRLAGKGTCSVDWLVLKNRVLQFKNPEYVTRRVDVVEYSTYVQGSATTEATTKWKYRDSGDKWEITEGGSPDCVYYLKLDNASASEPIFSLKEKVCGIKIVDDLGRLPP